jgi:phosphotransferase system enzyme I (PtsI)
MRAENVFWGIAVSPGIRMGTASVIRPKRLETPIVHVGEQQVSVEIRRLKKAVESSIEQLELLKERIDRGMGESHYFILEAHQLMLKDDSVINEAIRLIQDHQFSAEWSIKIIVKRLAKRFESMADEVFQKRATDVRDVGVRVLENLRGEVVRGLEQLRPDDLVVAHTITPGEATLFYNHPIRGFALEVGGKASHIAIIARSMEIPAVLGLDGLVDNVQSGDTMIIDGNHGVVVVNPDVEQVAEFERIRGNLEALDLMLHRHTDKPAITLDGVEITLKGNIESVEEIPSLSEHGAKGIGLFRTEFLYMNRQSPPSEEEHYEVYRRLVKGCTCGPVTIRTVDIGGDKLPTYWPVSDDSNPALGMRAVRTIVQNERYFIDQARAIYRAASHGRIKLLLPFISGVDELDMVLKLLAKVRKSLAAEGIPFDDQVPIGIMIELPSAAVISDLFATRADFFSIGTNDLIQYTLAVDRDAEQLSYLYTPLHPAILRMIRMTCDNGRTVGIPVAVCGEMASEAIHTMLLLGLGLTELDMPPAAIPYVKEIIRSCRMDEARKLAAKSLACSTASEVAKVIEPFMRKRWPKFFSV